jgi:BRCA1-associated protein
VHRLLQNKDGKVVEMRPTPALDDSCEEAEDKVDSMQLEFTYLLTTQLESQRYYFEEKLASQSRDMERELEKLHIRLEENDKYKEVTDTKLGNLTREKKDLEKKVNKHKQINVVAVF